jgi:hypothetical protein
MSASHKVEAREVEIDGFHGLIAAACGNPAFLAVLTPPDAIWSRPGVAIMNEGRNRIGRLRLQTSSGAPPVDIVVKEFSSRGVNKLKSLILPSKAAKAWRGAVALAESGLGTALPVAFLARKKRGFVERSFFLSEGIKDATEVRELFRSLPASALEPLLAALAGFLSAGHARGILHRDLSDGNILVKKGPGGDFAFFLLDTNRIRLRRRIGALARAKNLIRLGIPASHRDFFLGQYFGAPPAAPVRLWYKFNKSAFTNYVALKRRLRLRKIARALGIQ